VRAGHVFLQGPEELIIRGLNGKEAAEKLIYGNLTLYGNALFLGAIFTQVQLASDAVGNLGEMNGCFVFVANLTLHFITSRSLYQNSSTASTGIAFSNIDKFEKPLQGDLSFSGV
jgi:hypothetical protein